MAATTAIVVSAAASIYAANKERKIRKEAVAAEDERNREEKAIKEQELLKKGEIFRAEKTNLLKARLASHRARMGALGLDAGSRSSNALMGSIEKEVDEQLGNDEFFLGLNLKNLGGVYSYKKKKNLLESDSSRLRRDKSYYDAGETFYTGMNSLYGK